MITVTAPEGKKQKTNRLCYLFMIFLTGCQVGWAHEEIFYCITEGMLRNRGILYGPWLSIYSIGALDIYAMKPMKKNPVLLFFLCAAVAGIVEHIIGLPESIFWGCDFGMTGAALEQRWNHLIPQRGKLCSHGSGVPLSAGTGGRADNPKAAAQKRSSCLFGTTASVCSRLRFEWPVPYADHILGEGKMKDRYFTSRMLICAGALMSISGILITICAKLAYGGLLFAAAACMFFAARNFRIAEDKKANENQEAETGHEKE